MTELDIDLQDGRVLGAHSHFVTRVIHIHKTRIAVVGPDRAEFRLVFGAYARVMEHEKAEAAYFTTLEAAREWASALIPREAAG